MGWPGTNIAKEDEDHVREQVQKEFNAAPVFLD